jgi:nucleoside-diphosphate-sugar epimerase
MRPEPQPAAAPKSILITGAYGLVGNGLFAHLDRRPDRYRVYGLGRRMARSQRLKADNCYPIDQRQYRVADVADLPAMIEAVKGMDVVVHAAADPGSNDWESILTNNIRGVRNVLEACRTNGVSRIVLTSSAQVNWGYGQLPEYREAFSGACAELPPGLRRIRHTDPPKPVSLYGASKVWMEALAHVYAMTHGLSCICVRIGWATPAGWPDRRMVFPSWCSMRDLTQLLEKVIQAPASLRFDIFNGVSDNRCRWADIEHAREVLGYAPEDRSEDFEERLKRKEEQKR